GTFGFKLALHFLFGFGLLERGELALRKDEALLRHLRLERLQTEFHGGEIVPAPDGANPEGRDCHASFQELIGDTNLAEGRLFDGKSRRRLRFPAPLGSSGSACVAKSPAGRVRHPCRKAP